MAHSEYDQPQLDEISAFLGRRFGMTADLERLTRLSASMQSLEWRMLKRQPATGSCRQASSEIRDGR